MGIQPLERQEGESAKAFQARQAYVQMGPGRSMPRVGQALGGCGGPKQLERWSKRWKWVASARAWDDHLNAISAKHAADKLIAANNARLELWIKRDDEQPNADYIAWSIAVAQLGQVQAGKLPASIRDTAIIIRSIAILSPIARAAREEMAARRLIKGYTRPDEHIPGRTKAMLKAAVDFEPEELDDDPDR